jgi:histidine phosphotransferase ChpT
MSSSRLAELLTSRLCHDLISPVGALLNGAELMADEEDAEMRRQAAGLMAESALETARRLAFFRLAFGAAARLGEMIAIDLGRDAAAGLFVKGRTRLDWLSRQDQPQAPKDELRLILKLILVAGTALPQGGSIQVRHGDTLGGAERGADRWVVVASGPLVRFDSTVANALTGALDDSSLTNETIVAQLAYHAAKAQNLTITVTENAEECRLRVDAS